MSDIDVSLGQAKLMVCALESLHDTLAEFHSGSGSAPMPGSQASEELSGTETRIFVEAAIAQGNLLAEAAADHVMALTRTLREPVQTVAPWACTRSALEAAALSCWLFDNEIGPRERCARSFALRLEGATQELKYARAKGDAAVESHANEVIGQLEAKAASLDIHSLSGARGEGPACRLRMPSITDLAGLVMGENLTYRLLSGAAHGHAWALSQMSFTRVDTGDALFLEKSLKPIFVAYLCVKCAPAMARPIWSKCLMYGWNDAALASALEAAYRLFPGGVSPARFWTKTGERQPG